MNKAIRLIERSISHNEITHAPYDEETAWDLEAAAEDSVESENVLEYWGMDDDGRAWRVHLGRYI